MYILCTFNSWSLKAVNFSVRISYCAQTHVFFSLRFDSLTSKNIFLHSKQWLFSVNHLTTVVLSLNLERIIISVIQNFLWEFTLNIGLVWCLPGIRKELLLDIIMRTTITINSGLVLLCNLRKNKFSNEWICNSLLNCVSFVFVHIFSNVNCFK